jgi:enamine deaminase RidA (YjgF/YER057c/UK114 family)
MNPSDAASIITRFGTTARSSLAVTQGNTSYFAVTPQAPYDPALTTAEQARELFAKAEARLAEIGSGRDHLLFVAILLADMADLGPFNAEWDAWLSDVSPPARACFQAVLANPALKVELIVVCGTGHDAREAWR